MDKKDILNAFEFRHACKEFDENKKIPDEDIRFILETGRLSPSSFGLEQWKFLVVQKPEIKAKLRSASYDQLQLTSCSHIIVILAKKGLYEPGSVHVAEMFKRWNYPEEIYNYVIDFHNNLAGSMDLTQWAVEQCHIAAANMITSAAMIGIDSCPIGGFEPDKAKEALKIDNEKYKMAMIIPFGYRINEQPPKTRLPFDEVVEFLT
ncbi:MAG: NAD(P)H-dependent oxidoreductase [Candidatus Anammoxibacter sp.]